MRQLATIKTAGGFSYGAMSFSPDGLWLATGTGGGEIELGGDFFEHQATIFVRETRRARETHVSAKRFT